MRLKTRFFFAAALAAVFVLLLAACGGGSNSANNSPGGNTGGNAGGGNSGGSGGGNGGGSGSTQVTYEYAYFNHKDSPSIDALKLGSDGSVSMANGSPFHAAVNAEQMAQGGSFVFINGTDPSGGGLFQSFKIDSQTGSLSAAGQLQYGTFPGNTAPTPAWNLVADPSGTNLSASFASLPNGPDDVNIAVFHVDPLTGAFSEIAGSPFGAGSYATVPQWLTLSLDGKWLYYTFGASGPHGTPFSYFLQSAIRDPNTGAVTTLQGPATPYARDDATEFGRIALTADGAYVLSLHNGVSVYSTAGGQLTAVPGSPFAAPGELTALTAGPTAAPFVYAGTTDGKVYGFVVQTSGALTPIAGSPWQVSGGVQDLALTHSGQFLVAAAQSAANAVVFKVDTKTGALSSPVTTSIGAPALRAVTGK